MSIILSLWDPIFIFYIELFISPIFITSDLNNIQSQDKQGLKILYRSSSNIIVWVPPNCITGSIYSFTSFFINVPWNTNFLHIFNFSHRVNIQIKRLNKNYFYVIKHIMDDFLSFCAIRTYNGRHPLNHQHFNRLPSAYSTPSSFFFVDMNTFLTCHVDWFSCITY